MDKQTRQILINTMTEIITEELLPVPNRILIRHPTQGKQRTGGTLTKSKHFNNNFRISITVSSPKYIPDENGKYWIKKNPTQRLKYIGWHEVSREKVIEIAAHEMAHLKFWSHEAEHKSYTLHLFTKLAERLKDWNCDKNEDT